MTSKAKEKAAADAAATAGDGFADELEREHAAAWKASAEGDKITGTVVEYATGYSTHPKATGPYPICVVEVRDGDVIVQDGKVEEAGDDARRSVHIFHAALRSQFERMDPKVGDRIGIGYKGKASNRAGDGEYHNFALRVKGNAQRPRGFRDVAVPDDATGDDGLPF